MSKSLRVTTFAALVICALLAPVQAQGDTARGLTRTYESWRAAMIRKDARQWQQVTSTRRRIEVRNRIVSEKLPFPAALFDLPAAPPTTKGLKLVAADAGPRTAKLTFFGKIDFGVGGAPTENLYVISYNKEGAQWKYDGAEFVSLAALPDVRAQILKGDLSYVKGADFKASKPRMSPAQVGKVDFVAKVYAFCPGRAVDVVVNGRSKHRFQNDKKAEIVIGGAKLGANEISFKTRKLEGGKGNEAFTVRVYLMPTKPGVQPIKIYESIAQEGEAVKASEKARFVTTAEMKAQLE